MEKKLRLVLSGSLAAMTAGLCLLYGQQVHAEADAERAEVLERFGGERVQLVVAADGLEAGDTVTRQNVELREWVADLAPAGALMSLDDVVDRQITVPAAEGAPLTGLNFRDEGQMPEVPSGYMALQVPLSEKLGLTTSAPAGARLVAYEVADDGTRLIAGDVQVLVAAGAASGTGAVSRGSISVAVRPDDVAALLAASAEGSLRLVVPSSDVDLAGAEPAPTNVEAGSPGAEETEGPGAEGAGAQGSKTAEEGDAQ